MLISFEERIRALAEKAKLNRQHLLTEEAAKNALVMPFLAALGYDVFDPMEVVPEFVADVGVKKGEKVDYAVHHNGVLSLLVECKPQGVTLDSSHLSQLYRYFSVTSARFAILTNGIVYQFYTDLEATNILDKRPFLVFDLLDIKPNLIPELTKFTREAFNVDGILATANTLKYIEAIKAEISREIESPSDDLVRMLTGRVYDGRLTNSIRTEFSEITKSAFREFLNDAIRARLSSALEARPPVVEESSIPVASPPADDTSDIVTTAEEVEAFVIIKAIVRSALPPGRIFMRDQKTYCSILADDNNRKRIARLYLHGAKKFIGIFDNEPEERVPLSGVDDIFSFSERLIAAAKRFA